MSTPQVRLRLPRGLAADAGGRRQLDVPVPGPGTLDALLDDLRVSHPSLERRVRDETGTLRRFVNVYLDGVDVRQVAGLATAVAGGQTVEVIQSVAGG